MTHTRRSARGFGLVALTVSLGAMFGSCVVEVRPFGSGFRVDKIVAQRDHTCALVLEESATVGAIYCWGDHRTPVLGATTEDGQNPGIVRVSGDRWFDVAVGWSHSCGLTDEQLRCWGSAEFSQLGTLSGWVESPTPIQAAPIALELWAGPYMTCLRAEGSGIECVGASETPWLLGRDWGEPAEFDLVGSGEHLGAASFGPAHACALYEDQTVSCWGSNEGGALGIDLISSEIITTIPEAVVADDERTWQSVAVGSEHTCGVSEGELFCWGAGEYSGLLTDALLGVPSPVPRTFGDVDVRNVYAGIEGTCLITEEDELWCAGVNRSGRFGIGVGGELYDGFVEARAGVREVALGQDHMCLRDLDGYVFCAGSDELFQQGGGAGGVGSFGALRDPS